MKMKLETFLIFLLILFLLYLVYNKCSSKCSNKCNNFSVGIPGEQTDDMPNYCSSYEGHKFGLLEKTENINYKIAMIKSAEERYFYTKNNILFIFTDEYVTEAQSSGIKLSDVSNISEINEYDVPSYSYFCFWYINKWYYIWAHNYKQRQIVQLENLRDYIILCSNETIFIGYFDNLGLFLDADQDTNYVKRAFAINKNSLFPKLVYGETEEKLNRNDIIHSIRIDKLAVIGKYMNNQKGYIVLKYENELEWVLKTDNIGSRDNLINMIHKLTGLPIMEGSDIKPVFFKNPSPLGPSQHPGGIIGAGGIMRDKKTPGNSQ